MNYQSFGQIKQNSEGNVVIDMKTYRMLYTKFYECDTLITEYDQKLEIKDSIIFYKDIQIQKLTSILEVKDTTIKQLVMINKHQTIPTNNSVRSKYLVVIVGVLSFIIGLSF